MGSARTITSGAKTGTATSSHAPLIPPAAVTFAWAREANVARTLWAATLPAAREARAAGMHVQLQAASAADHWADRSASGIQSPRPPSVPVDGSAVAQWIITPCRAGFQGRNRSLLAPWQDSRITP